MMNRRVNIDPDLLDAICDVLARDKAGQPVTAGERAWIEAELAATPGYLEWHAADLLRRTLNPVKALV
jgi:hypothetical protein